MLKSLFTLIIITILYFFATFLYSLVFGIPPFNNGIVVGYPALYYQFNISKTETQSGFIGNFNLLANVFIILIFFFIVKIVKKKETE